MIREISYDHVYKILSNFAKVIPKVEPEKQKDLLHAVIKSITVNPSNDINKRSIKNIELFFDASFKNDDYVFTYDTVHRNVG
jgi:site-specific DNA recombinase